MRGYIQEVDTFPLQMNWTEQLFQETERDLEQGDLHDTMQNVLFYASLLLQRQQKLEAGIETNLAELPLTWLLVSEEEIIALVKSSVPFYYHELLDLALTTQGEGAFSIAFEAEQRGCAADFIRYAQGRLKLPSGLNHSYDPEGQ